jgi:hypothetical protein
LSWVAIISLVLRVRPMPALLIRISMVLKAARKSAAVFFQGRGTGFLPIPLHRNTGRFDHGDRGANHLGPDTVTWNQRYSRCIADMARTISNHCQALTVSFCRKCRR